VKIKMGMSDELARRMDKRSKEEKKAMVDRMTAEKMSKMKQGDRDEKSGIMAKIWGVIRKWTRVN
jgi:hypothetical protein